MDYSSLNKACAKDMYPFLEGRRRASIFNGISVQMFPQLPKEYSQIRMAEEDEEKTGFHMEEGVYYFTHMPKELKNFAATLQRMMEKHPLREARTRMEITKGYGWTNEAEEAFRRIKWKSGKLPTLAILKEGEDLMLCLRQRNETISSVLLVKVVTDGPKEETLKLSGREGRLGKWAPKIRTYDILYVQRKEVEGPVIRKFFGQGEQVEKIPNTNEGGKLNLSKKLHTKSTSTPSAWRLYLGKEAIEEVLGIGIILVSPKEKMYSYAIRLKFKASSYAMDYEALLARLAASANQGMKDLHVFIDSLTLVAQVEGNHMPATEQERNTKKKL
ncbi:reverse transcriptase domain-containing protein [Tanacetum coccineum]